MNLHGRLSLSDPSVKHLSFGEISLRYTERLKEGLGGSTTVGFHSAQFSEEFCHDRAIHCTRLPLLPLGSQHRSAFSCWQLLQNAGHLGLGLNPARNGERSY